MSNPLRRRSVFGAALALFLSFALPASATTATARPFNVVYELGDSVTQFGYANVKGGFIDQINATLGTSRVTRVSLLRVGGKPMRLVGGSVTYVNRGVAGWFSAQIVADSATVVTLLPKPDFILLDIGINDALNGVDPATFRTNLDSALNTYQASLPGCQIEVVSPFLNGEQWTATGPALANTTDALVDAVVAQASASAAAHGVAFAPTRPAALTYEVAHNTPAPGIQFGILMDDQLRHPTIPLGQVFLSTQAMAGVTVSP